MVAFTTSSAAAIQKPFERLVRMLALWPLPVSVSCP
jgi:hypothetical protein